MYDQHSQTASRLMRSKAQAALVRQLYSQGYPLAWVFPPTIAVLCLILNPFVPGNMLVGWFLVILVLGIYRLIITRKYKHRNPVSDTGKDWELAYLVLELLSGISVGMSMYFVVYLEPLFQLAIFLLIIGTNTGGAAILSPSFKVASTYLVSSTATALGWLVYFGDIFYYSLAAMGLAHSGLMLITAFKLGNILKQSLILRFQNDALLEEKNIINQELLVSKAQLEDAYNAKSLFLSNISHEIRTPLNGIMGAIELLKQDDKKREHRKLIDIATSASENLLSLLNNLLDVSKTESHELEVENIPFDLHDLFTQVSEILKLQATRKCLALTFSIGCKVPKDLVGDPLRLRQILNNLGSNAIKFTDEGRIDLRVTESGCENNRVTLLFEVEDTGIGINPVAQKSIFNAFTQADSSTTRKYGGTGLGLAIVQQLTKRLGGNSGVRSRVGRGSIFWIKIPFLRDQQNAFKNLNPVPDNILTQETSSLKALLVEDNEANRVIAVKTLENLGIQVDIAINGAEALTRLETSNYDYDIVFMDCQMPVKDGFETTRDIRDREGPEEHIVIVAITANVARGDRERCLAAGMDGYIPKPIKIDTVEKEIRKFKPGWRTASQPSTR